MKYVFILLAFICLNASTNAQTIKASDHARAGLESSASTNVDYATGIMNYYIPLIKKDDGGPSINFGLSYAAKGIKTNQIPSVVGLGWNFMGEGVVTRTTRGLQDDALMGILRNPIPSNPIALETFKIQVNNGERDGETDIFTINYAQAGLNEKFFIEFIPSPVDYNHLFQAVSLTKSDVKITILNDNYSKILGFEVVNANGETFYFMAKETRGALIDGSFGSAMKETYQDQNAWYLTEVKDKTGEKITFEYYDDMTSENQRLTTEQALFYGQDWLEYGKNELITGQIKSYMDQVHTNLAARENINNRINWLNENIDYQFWKIRNSDFSGFYNSISGMGGYGYGAASYLPGYTQQTMSTYLINGYRSEIQSLSAQIPAYYGQQSDMYLESLMDQLYTTPNYKKSAIFRSPLASFRQVKLLKRIQLKNSSVEFKYTTSMRGASASISEQPKTFLEQINILGNDGTVLNIVGFEYSPVLYGIGKSFLKALTIKGADSKDGESKYRFDYIQEGVEPDLTSKDFWGFYRGINNDGSLLPNEMTIDSAFSPYARQVFQHPDHEYLILDTAGLTFGSRAPSPIHTTYRSLKTIHLPDGGKCEFEYENNTIPHETIPLVSVLSGGLRIKKIKTFDGLGGEYTKAFKYEFADGGSNQFVSSGYNVKRGYQTMTLRINYPNIPDDVMLLSDPAYLGPQLEDSGNEGVFYTYVEEINEGKGRTGYRYLKVVPLNDIYPYWLERLLLAQTEYDETGNLKNIERFKYQIAQENYFGNEEHSISFNGSYGFNLNKPQLKAFPFTPYQYDISMYSYDRNNTTYYHYDADNLYNYNMQTRLTITNPTISYAFRYGGAVVLKETERWTSGQSITSGATIPAPLIYQNIAINNPLFAASYGEGSWNKQIYYYDNQSHTYPNRVESTASDGEKSCIKTKYLADYNSGAASFITALHNHNRKKEIIETQKWIFDRSVSSWKFIDGELTTYNIINPSPQDLSGRQCILPGSIYKTELEQPVSPGADGWNEQLITAGPYATVFHESQMVYKPNTTLNWNASSWGIQYAGKSVNNGLSNEAICSDGFNQVQVKGAKASEVLMLSYRGSPIRKKVTMDNLDNFCNPFDIINSKHDNVGYARDLLYRIKFISVNSNASYVLYALDSLLLTIDQHLDYDVFDRCRTMLETQLTQIPPDQDSFYDQDLSPHTSMLEIRFFLSAMQCYYLIHSGMYDLMLGLQHYAVTATGDFECRLNLDSYKQSGKRLQFTSRNSFGLTYKVYYNGSPPQTYPISSSMSRNNISYAFLDPSTIPNANNAVELSFNINNELREQDLFVVPEGAPFQFTSKDNSGNLNYTFNEKGDFYFYNYDSRQRLLDVKNKDLNYLKSFRYNSFPNQ